MKSRTSCCNGTILKKTLLRGAPLWGMYLLLWTVMMPMRIYPTENWYRIQSLEQYILELGVMGGNYMPAIYGLFSACMVFSYLYKSRSANFYAALPVKRQTMFLTNYLAGLLYALAPNLLIALVCLPAGALYGTSLVWELLVWFGCHTLNYVFYYSFAVLLAMIVGHLVALPLLYVVLNFTVIVVESIIRQLMSYFVYGLYFRGNFLFDWASPLAYSCLQGEGPDVNSVYLDGEFVRWELSGMDYLAALAVVGVVFAVLAFFPHQYRRMESAGDVIAVRRLKPVFLYCFTAGCSLVIGYVMAELLIRDLSFAAVLACMLVGATIGYFAGQMMLHKSMRVFRKRHWVNWAASCLVISAVMLCVRFDMLGYTSYVPETDEIQAVSVTYASDFSEDPALIEQVRELHQLCLDRRDEEVAGEPYYASLYLSYALKDGSVVERQYDLPINTELSQDADSLVRRYESIWNDPDYILVRTLPQGYTAQDIEMCHIYNENGDEFYLTKQQAYDFLKTVLEPELRETTLGWDIWSEHAQELQSSFTGIYIDIVFRENTSGEFVPTFYSGVTYDCQRILAFAAEHGIEPTEEELAETDEAW